MRAPDKPFLHWIDRDRSLTYEQAAETSARVAGGLAGLGIGKGDRVGILAHNGLDYITAMFGAWRLGAITSHINVLQADDLAYFAQDSTPSVLIYTHDMFPAIERDRSSMPSIRHYVCMDGEQEGAVDWNALVASATPAPVADVADTDGAHLSYTSGSSGQPKGVLLAHGTTARATNCIAERLRLSGDDASLGATSPASSYGLVANLLPGLHRGMTIGLMSRWDATRAWDVMNERGISYLPANPILLGEFLEECRTRRGKPGRFRLAVSGGAPVPLALKQALAEELDVPLAESYGQSELGGFVALGRPVHEPEERLSAIGPPLPDKEVRIMGESGQEAAIGEPGEICLRGGFMIAYWNRPEQTQEAIAEGWLHTGDMGTMDSAGYVSMLGRWSERILSAGRVVYPRPIEESLLRHPAVGYACVIASRNAQAIKAIVTLRDGQVANERDLLDHCAADVRAPEKPTELEIVAEMPMTATGKIGRMQLQERERQLA